MKLNSIIFHTSNLRNLREFYENKLGLKVGTFEKNGEVISDCSDTYVNYNLNGVLFCFEFEEGRCDLGTAVVNVTSLVDFKNRMERFRIQVVGDGRRFVKIKDPDGRTLIIEEES